MSGEQTILQGTATIAANGRVDRNVGRHLEKTMNTAPPTLPKKPPAAFHHPLGFELYDRLAMDLHAMAYAEPMLKQIEQMRLAEEGAKEVFGHVVQQKRDLEAECKRLRSLLDGAYETIRRQAVPPNVKWMAISPYFLENRHPSWPALQVKRGSLRGFGVGRPNYFRGWMAMKHGAATGYAARAPYILDARRLFWRTWHFQRYLSYG